LKFSQLSHQCTHTWLPSPYDETCQSPLTNSWQCQHALTVRAVQATKQGGLPCEHSIPSSGSHVSTTDVSCAHRSKIESVKKSLSIGVPSKLYKASSAVTRVGIGASKQINRSSYVSNNPSLTLHHFYYSSHGTEMPAMCTVPVLRTSKPPFEMTTNAQSSIFCLSSATGKPSRQATAPREATNGPNRRDFPKSSPATNTTQQATAPREATNGPD